ncbi:2-ketoisovalerate ferredoxin oxidoreductase subunit alpha [Archaeoglobus veneficus]|uniref:Pyruvate synthase n=1 Tax=Archaeoglobus veneficus (strain DSM 11195 / SNP6) TaxID=693661 RepID=F2KRX2_ARCVS|nr:2-ketoisovalerate ferredoxin oxidoreductase subunit alpha [Archaeoglobus veneficus]AEA46813.1 Pyruvate synthase [Archaeoglobus veneficus SNP6]
MKYVVQEGSHSIAEAVALCRPDVIAAFPITPQTHIVERLAELVANGTLDAEFVNVESEHSALSLIAGAEACGMRTYTATSSQGLALMHEVLHAVSGMRLPVVMTVANRALSAPLNIWNDHSDSMSQRDTSWMQFYAESVQEAVDLTIQAYRIAESSDVMLPAMICMDGYVLTHTYEPVILPDRALVDEFLPPYEPEYRLDPENPMTFGVYALPSDYMEFKWEQQKAMENAKRRIIRANREYRKMFGRTYGNGLIETYNMDGAEVALIAMGSICGTIKEAIEHMNGVGLVRLRTYRPFPFDELRNTLKDVETVVVIDRAFSYGFEGPLFSEVKAALYTMDSRPKVCNFVVGLGGRDTRIADVEEIVEKAKKLEGGEVVWFKLRA